MSEPTQAAAQSGQPKQNASPSPKPTPPQPEAGDPPKVQNEPPLGEGGKKALDAEREARKELEKKLKALEPLQKIAEALGQGDAEKGKSELEQLNARLSKHEEELGAERMARFRAEVANEKGLSAKQAARLAGSTKEELAADADDLLATFPAAKGSSTPKPDHSQGARGGTDLDAQIAEAEKKGDVRTSIRLKQQKAHAARSK